MLKNLVSRLILNYFKSLAHVQLKKNPHATIIGITGSAGKTSTRLAIVHILKNRGRVKQSVHANSESGIPLNILGLHPSTYSPLDWLRLILLAPCMLLLNWERYDYYVVEMGIDSPDAPKNMSYLLKIIRPHVGVVLNAGLTHTAAFDHLVKDKDPVRRMAKLRRAVAKEKMQLARGIKGSGVAVINVDQKELSLERRDITARQITFGKSDKAMLHIGKVGLDKQGFTMEYTYQGHRYQLKLADIFSENYAYTFAAAIATTAAIGIPPTLSVMSLSSYRAPAGRLRIFKGLKGSTIIDSSYNASPDTMLESLKLLKKLSSRGKKIAVLGDMRELGLSSKLAHKNLADWIREYSDEAILFGELTLEHTYPVLKSKKFPVTHFKHIKELTAYLTSKLSGSAYVLVKGSQNTILLERVVEAILHDRVDIGKLARRGHYWDKIRAHTP